MNNAILDPTDATSPLSISPHETAVLLMDYQNLYHSRVGDGAWSSIIYIASRLREWALERNMTVFHCLLDFSPGTRPAGYARISSKWKAYEAAFAATPGLGHESDMLAGVRAHPNFEITVFRTPGLSSVLESRGLIEMLRAKGIKSLILGGISTSGCVLSTARAATDRGFIVTVVSRQTQTVLVPRCTGSLPLVPVSCVSY